MRQAHPDEARTGTFLRTFAIYDFKDMIRYCEETERAMFRNRIKGEILYTKIPAWGRRRRNDTWQVFLLP